VLRTVDRKTLVCNEAQRICWRSAASEGGNLTRLASWTMFFSLRNHM
jgi:hypothetical protein